MAAGKLGNLMAAVWAPRLPAWMGKQHGKGLCRKQEGNRKGHTPVFVRSQNESVPPLVPRLSGINVKDSWLLSSPVSTFLPEEALALSCFQLLAQ